MNLEDNNTHGDIAYQRADLIKYEDDDVIYSKLRNRLYEFKKRMLANEFDHHNLMTNISIYQYMLRKRTHVITTG